MSGTTVFWYASRATGIVALLLLTAVLVLGILVNRQGRLPGLPRFAVTDIHRNLSLLAVTFIAIHVVTAVLDTYVHIPLLSAVIPFASGYERLWLGLGGDIAVAGPAPEGGWRIRVQDVTGSPGDPPDGPYALVAIRDGGLATSSTAARRWQRGGDVLHHILDPRTGLPAEPVWRTVSVAAGTCADANAASTAAVIRGRAALGWLAKLGLPSRLVDATGAVFTVAGWPDDTSELSQNQLAAFMHLAQQ